MAGIPEDKQQQLLQLTGFAQGSFPVKYLGIPLSLRKWSIADCHALVEKITTRINTWTTRHLSYAGRLQLINSVIFSLHTYWSSMFILPKKSSSKLRHYAGTFYGATL